MPTPRKRPTNRPPATQTALTVVPPLTATQRRKVLAHYKAHPDSGYKAALAAAGIHATRRAARAAILNDPELEAAPFEALGVDEGSAFKAIGEMIADPEHKDRLRAATFAANINGWREKGEVAITGAEGGPLEVSVEDRSASFADVLAVLTQAGVDVG